MENTELGKIQQEAFEHLHKGRSRLALPLAEKLIMQNPESSEAAVCYAWASLENGDVVTAEHYTNLSESLNDNSIIARMYRGYLQMRLSSFETAIYDFNMTEGKQKELLAWTYLNKSKSLASIGDFLKATSFFELCLMIDNNAHPEWKETRKYFNALEKLGADIKKLSPDRISKILKLIVSGLKEKEYWFVLIAASRINSTTELYKKQPLLLLAELEAMLKMNQFTVLEEKLEQYEPYLKENDRYLSIKQSLEKYKTSRDNPVKTPDTDTAKQISNPELTDNPYTEVFSVALFDADKQSDSEEKINHVEVNLQSQPNMGVEIICNNLFYNKEPKTHACFIAWYLNDDLVHQSTFTLEVPQDWDAFVIRDFSDARSNKFWENGNARVELFLNRQKIVAYSFKCGDQNVVSKIDLSNKKSEPLEETIVPNDNAMDELDKIIGLENVKSSVKELIDYLEFMKERKQLGLKAKDKISVHATFLGNPGTGKTTVARLMGRIFKSMGLLEKGEVIEVDRSALVGQYVGETAQKTEKIIEEAIGNVLFIDEAYTLVKKGAGNDFGQEAVDTLLKRMEDRKGEFFVIVAGYPREMDDFLSSNPGLKSRFTHHFTFDDYNPDELLKIFKSMMKDEDYRIMNSSEVMLSKELTNLYRNRDENFGNARTVRKLFEDVKMQVSKRYLSLEKHERTKEKLVTIFEEDIREIVSVKEEKSDFDVPVNEEMLNEALSELNKLVGLSSVKKDVNELIKLAKFYRESGDDLRSKFSSHILFLGNPGTGKTTVARILAKIYSALGILPGGQLIETDRQGLVASYVGQTANLTTEIINKSMGGTLFIDEAYSLVKAGGQDFGQEAIDTLLKRMEDDRGKFIVIAAGYTEEMKSFLESNPGLKSRFTKTFHFEDYNPVECMTILKAMSSKNNLVMNDEAQSALDKYLNKLYRERDKNYGNARLVRNMFDSINKKHSLRLVELDQESITNEIKSTVTVEDLEDILPKKVQKSFAIKGDAEKLDEYLNTLKSMTGLDEVKEGVEKIVGSIKITQMRKERGMEVIQKSLHAVFTGNPGTGKTTVARLLSNIFKELGILAKGQLVEVDRAQLVAGYSGQTAIKTDEIIQKALGGTLFIDEAYTLSRGSGDFGQEAIDTLLKRMEDYKGQFIVIVAGYTNEMKIFVDSNPGLASRFTNTFHFADYNPDQLTEIAMSMAKSSGYEFDESGLNALIARFTELYDNRDGNFGNARTARNVLLEVISNQESRLSLMINPSDDDLRKLNEQDVSAK